MIQLGFINKTPRGRVATQLAYAHMGYQYNGNDTQQMKLDISED